MELAAALSQEAGAGEDWLTAAVRTCGWLWDLVRITGVTADSKLHLAHVLGVSTHVGGGLSPHDLRQLLICFNLAALHEPAGMVHHVLGDYDAAIRAFLRGTFMPLGAFLYCARALAALGPYPNLRTRFLHAIRPAAGQLMD